MSLIKANAVKIGFVKDGFMYALRKADAATALNKIFQD